MPRYITSVIIIGLTALLASCDYNKKEQAIELDNRLSKVNDTLLHLGKQWGDEFEIAVNTLDFTHLQPLRVKMVKYIDGKIEYVEGLDNVGGSEELIKAELDFLKAEKDIISKRFVIFERFTDSVSMDELSNAYTGVLMGAEREQQKLEDLQKLRLEYAEKNGFPKPIE